MLQEFLLGSLFDLRGWISEWNSSTSGILLRLNGTSQKIQIGGYVVITTLSEVHRTTAASESTRRASHISKWSLEEASSKSFS